MKKLKLDPIAQIYDVIMDPGKWTPVLDNLALETNAEGLSIFITDHSADELTAIHLSSKLLPFFESYLENRYDALEVPFTLDVVKIAKSQKLLEIKALTRQLNRDFSTKHDLSEVEEWSRKCFGVHHRYTSPLGFESSYFDMATFQFGDIERADLNKMVTKANGFLPHLQKAIACSRPFKILQYRFNSIFSVLDRFHLGVIVLAQDQSVVITNKAADEILHNNNGLLLDSRNRLTAVSPEINVQMRTEIKNACSLAEALSDAIHTPLYIARSDGKAPLIVELTALRNDELDIQTKFKGALALVIDPDNTPIVDTTGMDALFGLTESEQDICKLLTCGYSTIEIAEQRNSKPATVQKQIKSTLAKTSTHSRADLIRLALSINLPIDK